MTAERACENTVEADLNRLLRHLQFTESCWLWKGALNSGYGHCSYNKRTTGAHRAFYMLLVGPIPQCLTVDHLCRVRNCVNPDHLELVTMRENILRGTSPFAQHAKRTHCPRGHALSGDNVIRSVKGRECRTCKIARDHVRWTTLPEPKRSIRNRLKRERRAAERERKWATS